MTKLTFGPLIRPQQGEGPPVYCFTATPERVEQIARIQRIGRDEKGELHGFQRPQIAAHIREIEDYLRLPEAMLPNAIVLAFAGRVHVEDGSLTIDISNGAPGWVVDGQQRLTAALRLPDRDFEFVVSAFVCEDLAELNRQFILINNTRPLPKALVYELLPGVEGLPKRLSERAQSAVLVEALNYRQDSSLHGQILQQTNPGGVLRDTVMQKALMNSLNNGALRNMTPETLRGEGYELLNAFWAAVQDVFETEWVGHTPKTSRLVHGIGIVSMGYVFDELVHDGATSKVAFVEGLSSLVGHTHWTRGEWQIGSEQRPWNGLQNTKADYWLISNHLVRRLRRRSSATVAAA